MPLELVRSYLSKRLPIAGSNLYLARPRPEHFDQWVELRRQSKEFLIPWEPRWPEDDLTEFGYKRRLRNYQRHRSTGWGHTYFIFDKSQHELLGGISLMRVTHGIARSGVIGFWMGAPHANKGHMQRVVPEILRFAFEELRLRRVEAACLPRNDRSRHLLLKCGFRQEGYAKAYLEINGTAEDHLLFAIVREDYKRH